MGVRVVTGVKVVGGLKGVRGVSGVVEMAPRSPTGLGTFVVRGNEQPHALAIARTTARTALATCWRRRSTLPAPHVPCAMPRASCEGSGRPSIAQVASQYRKPVQTPIPWPIPCCCACLESKLGGFVVYGLTSPTPNPPPRPPVTSPATGSALRTTSTTAKRDRRQGPAAIDRSKPQSKPQSKPTRLDVQIGIETSGLDSRPTGAYLRCPSTSSVHMSVQRGDWRLECSTMPKKLRNWLAPAPALRTCLKNVLRGEPCLDHALVRSVGRSSCSECGNPFGRSDFK